MGKFSPTKELWSSEELGPISIAVPLKTTSLMNVQKEHTLTQTLIHVERHNF